MRSGWRAFPEGRTSLPGNARQNFMKKRKSVIFTDKRNSNRAIMSVILGIISLVSLGVVMFFSYRSGGEVRFGHGVTAFLAALYSMTGLALGLVTVQKKEYNKWFPVLGILLNAATLACVGLILYMGGRLE